VTFTNPLLDRWANGGVVCSAWVTSGEPLTASFLASCGFDEVIVDLQHGAVEVGHLPALFAAIEARGVAPAVRVPTNNAATIGRVLDLGALSVMVPLVETAEEAARAVAASRYAPLGRRSMGPLRAMTSMGSEDPDDLSRVAIFVQIETALGLQNAAAIAATPGLTGVFIGPADLSISLGLAGPGGEALAGREAAHASILATCQKAGIVPGFITGNGTDGARRIEQGFRYLTVTADLDLIVTGGARELAAARAARVA